jgi:hypothetical protein
MSACLSFMRFFQADALRGKVRKDSLLLRFSQASLHNGEERETPNATCLLVMLQLSV